MEKNILMVSNKIVHKMRIENPESLAAVYIYIGNLEAEKSEIKIRGKPPN